MHPNPVLDFLRSRQADMRAELERLAALESPSRDRPALERVAGVLAQRLGALGGAVERLRDVDGGPHVLARFPGVGDRKPALVLGHFDTVWPVGALARMPLRERDGRLYGPGVFDMKANLVIVNHVLEALGRLELHPPRPVAVLYTSDEEVGSLGSRPIIEDAARASEYVLVVEPPLADGSLKTARKGVGRFTIEVEGRAAHAGVAPERGASAIVELAHQVLRLRAMNDRGAGTTVNVGVVQGGTVSNVVPARAVAQVDVRAATLSAASLVELSLRALEPITPGTSLRVEGGFTRPPMERSPAIAGLFARAQEIARSLGVELTEGSTGGGSDGNFTAALGLPTLDGLGALGGGAHAHDEHVILDSLPERGALLAHLILHLSA